MSKLSDLRAALAAKQEAARQMRTAFEAGEPFMRLRIDYDASWKALERLLTDDTIAKLIAVAQAAEHEPRCPFCAEERHIAGWPTQPHLSDCPLAPLVKEADHDRA